MGGRQGEEPTHRTFRSAQRCSGCKVASEGDTSMMKCSGCNAALYCSRDCQTKDWKRHKPICKGTAVLEPTCFMARCDASGCFFVTMFAQIPGSRGFSIGSLCVRTLQGVRNGQTILPSCGYLDQANLARSDLEKLETLEFVVHAKVFRNDGFDGRVMTVEQQGPPRRQTFVQVDPTFAKALVEQALQETPGKKCPKDAREALQWFQSMQASPAGAELRVVEPLEAFMSSKENELEVSRLEKLAAVALQPDGFIPALPVQGLAGLVYAMLCTRGEYVDAYHFVEDLHSAVQGNYRDWPAGATAQEEQLQWIVQKVGAVEYVGRRLARICQHQARYHLLVGDKRLASLLHFAGKDVEKSFSASAMLQAMAMRTVPQLDQPAGADLCAGRGVEFDTCPFDECPRSELFLDAMFSKKLVAQLGITDSPAIYYFDTPALPLPAEMTRAMQAAQQSAWRGA